MGTLFCFGSKKKPFLDLYLVFGYTNRKDPFHGLDIVLSILLARKVKRVNKSGFLDLVTIVVSRGSNLMRGRLIEGNVYRQCLAVTKSMHPL